ncbi:MAG: Ig-like domain-containing protein [Bacilli bacterium]|nr:Ig-like domain-containing protein [Bacilli bacterium]
MKRSFKLFSLVLLLAILFLPFNVNAEEVIHFNLPSAPVVGETASTIASNQYIDVEDQYWVNFSEHRLMTANETFAADKVYGYFINYSLKDNIEYDWFTDLVLNPYCYESLDVDNDGDKHAEAYFYMGKISEALGPTDADKYQIDIDAPELGETQPLARTNSKYTILDQAWENVTDDHPMRTEEEFEENKWYKYTITVKSFYFADGTDVFRAFNGAGDAYLGMDQRDSKYDVAPKTINGYFYFGDTSGFLISTSDVIIREDHPPVIGGILTVPQMALTGTVEASAKWEVLEGDEFVDAEVNEEVVAGKTYRFVLELIAAPGYHFADDFEVLDENRNANFVDREGHIEEGNKYIYTSTFVILPEGSTIGIVGDDLIYPGETTQLTVFPTNDVNANVTWSSSNNAVATVDQQGNVTGVASGTVYITATNSINDFTTFEMTIGVPVEDIEVQSSEITLYVGDSQQLKAAVLPDEATNQGISWELDLDLGHQYGDDYNPDAAILVGDRIYAQEEGVIKVFAIADYDDSIRVPVTITVIPRPIDVESVSFERNRFEIYEGESVVLSPIVLPENATDKTLAWSFEGTSYVSFNPSTLTATGIKEGTGRIIARSVNNITATCTVIVKKRPPEAEEITFQDQTLELGVGETKTLTVNIVPENALVESITWSSADSTIVSVTDAGVIEALKEGTTTIKARTNKGLEATCTVTVSNIVAVTKIRLNKEETTLTVGESETLTATLTPSNATDKTVIWTSDHPEIVTVNNGGKITAVKAGTAMIVAEASNGKKATCFVTVKSAAPVQEISFPDVSKSSWYYETIKTAYNKGIIAGYASGEFGPNDKITRGQLVTLLWRLDGSPSAASYSNKFSDVNVSQYYGAAVKWAAAKDIVHGYGTAAGKFGPNNYIVRQDLAIILYNYARYKGLDLTASGNLSGFADYNKVKGNYSEAAFKWAVKYNIISGKNIKNKKYLEPGSNTTRAEAAAMIVNFANAFDI